MPFLSRPQGAQVGRGNPLEVCAHLTEEHTSSYW